jgi:hypothetical protein
MHMVRPLDGVALGETGDPIQIMTGPNNWAGVVQVVVTGTLTVAVEGSLDNVTWIKLSADLTASAMYVVPGPVTYLRLKSSAGTGSAAALLKEVC